MPIRCLTVTGTRDRVAHRLDAVGDQRRLGHQAGAERAALHALARAAAVEVDLGVAPAPRRAAPPRPARPARCRRAAARPAARAGRSRDAAARRRAAARRSSPSRCRGARVRVSRRWKKRQWRSVQSIIGATHRRQSPHPRSVRTFASVSIFESATCGKPRRTTSRATDHGPPFRGGAGVRAEPGQPASSPTFPAPEREPRRSRRPGPTLSCSEMVRGEVRKPPPSQPHSR